MSSRPLFALIVASLISGCAAVDVPQQARYAPQLLDGTAVFGHSVAAAPEQDPLSVSLQMREFVAQDVGSSSFPHVRFHRLMHKLKQQGFFANPYDQSATFSAAQTFSQKKGNCVAYTNLFIALAREANLNARYQKVHVPPKWELSSGLLLRVNHINVHVGGVLLPGAGSDEISVDFNSVRPAKDSRKEIISDAHAASMFYANLSIEYLREADYEQAFAYLKRAALTAKDNPDVWTNLGALYSILDHDVFAEQAYRVARGIDGKDQAAISGLAKVLLRQGRVEEAEAFAALVLGYQRVNPYYHYARAEQAFNQGAFDQALEAINQAIKLKRRNPQFYALRAATAQQLGDQRLFAKSLRLQHRFSKKES
jgi:tetratricopeptide (TPR) repeat protein